MKAGELYKYTATQLMHYYYKYKKRKVRRLMKRGDFEQLEGYVDAANALGIVANAISWSEKELWEWGDQPGGQHFLGGEITGL